MRPTTSTCLWVIKTIFYHFDAVTHHVPLFVCFCVCVVGVLCRGRDQRHESPQKHAGMVFPISSVNQSTSVQLEFYWLTRRTMILILRLESRPSSGRPSEPGKLSSTFPRTTTRTTWQKSVCVWHTRTTTGRKTCR